MSPFFVTGYRQTVILTSEKENANPVTVNRDSPNDMKTICGNSHSLFRTRRTVSGDWAAWKRRTFSSLAVRERARALPRNVTRTISKYTYGVCFVVTRARVRVNVVGFRAENGPRPGPTGFVRVIYRQSVSKKSSRINGDIFRGVDRLSERFQTRPIYT